MSTFTVLFVVGLLAALQVLWVTSELPNTIEQTAIVDLHNDLRRHVRPPPANMCKMKWSPEAAKNANKVAAMCYSGHSPIGDRHFEMDINGENIKCGENIFKATYEADWLSAVFAWHSESAYFKYGVGPVGKNVTGHYTQLVWYKSNLIGCARAYCPDDVYKYVTVCHYCPPGNYNPHTPYLTGEFCGECKDACDGDLCTNPCNYDDIFGSCFTFNYLCQLSFFAGFCPKTCLCPDNTIQ